MRPIHLLAAVAALSLASCGEKEASRPKTEQEVKQEAAKMDRPLPGQYRSTVTITEFDIPGAPPQVADQMKQMMSGQKSHSTEYCLTKEDADKGYEDMLKKSQDGDCSFDKFDASSNTIDAAMRCKIGDQGSVTMAMNGTTSPTGMKMDMTVDQSMPATPGGKVHMKMQMESQRIGDCPAA